MHDIHPQPEIETYNLPLEEWDDQPITVLDRRLNLRGLHMAPLGKDLDFIGNLTRQETEVVRAPYMIQLNNSSMELEVYEGARIHTADEDALRNRIIGHEARTSYQENYLT